MTVKPDFSRKKEEVWFPALTAAGFHNLALAKDSLDHTQATDIKGTKGGRRYRFAVRERDPTGYTRGRLGEYKREFTIRYSRPTGAPTEWTKLFSPDFPSKPDFFAYGWMDDKNHELADYVVLDVDVLRRLHDKGLLAGFAQRRKTNVDARQSTFVPLPIQRLNEMADGQLVSWHSFAHPALINPQERPPRDKSFNPRRWPREKW